MPEGFALGDYQLLEVIVRKAVWGSTVIPAAGINREVAVKMIRSDRFRFDRDVARFSKKLKRRFHADPIIVTVFDIGEVAVRFINAICRRYRLVPNREAI